MGMLKALTLALAFIFVLAPVSADIYLLSPFQELVKPGQPVYLGSMQPGQSIELIASNKTGAGDDVLWNRLEFSAESMPSGWKFVNSERGGKTMIASFSVPRNALQGDYSFTVEAISLDSRARNQKTEVKVSVARNLLRATMFDLKRVGVYGEPMDFRLELINDSVASDEIRIESDLPASWFRFSSVAVKSKGLTNHSLTVVPRVAGRKDFNFIVRLASTGEEVGRFSGVIDAKPTLKGKVGPALYGLPFYAFSLAPFYLFNALASIIF